jgi:hypothetical protein
MSRVVSIDLDVHDAKAVRAWQRSRDSIAEFDTQGQKTSKTFGNMMTDQVKGVAAMAAGFAGVGSIIGGIVTAAQMLRAEYDNIIQKQSAAAESNLTFEQALAKAIDNSTGIFSAAEVRSESLKLAAESGIKPEKAANIIGSAVTSTGVTNEEEARLSLTAAKAAAIYAPYLDDTALEEVAGVTASTAKRFGVSPEAALGFSERGRAQSNVRELAAYSGNVSPVINNLTEFGATPQEASALMAMMTQQLGDTTGEMSGTAAINLMKELRDRFGSQKRFQRDDGSFDPIKTIAAIQQSEEVQRRFFDGGDFFGRKFGKAALGKGKADPTIRGLLRSKDSIQSEQMSGSYFAIGGFAEGEQAYAESVLSKRAATPTEQARRIIQAETAITQANDPSGLSAVLREELPKYEQAMGDSAIGQRFKAITRELTSGVGTDPIAAINTAQQQLSLDAAELRRGKLRSETFYDPISATMIDEIRSPVTARDIEQAKSMDRLNAVLEKIENVIAAQVNLNSSPAVPQVFVNGRTAKAETRMSPESRHADLSSPPSPGRVSRAGGN